MDANGMTIEQTLDADIRRCLDDVATEFRSRGRDDHRFVQLIARIDAFARAGTKQLLARNPEADRLRSLINAPEIDAFLRGTHIEAVHQVERWGTAHDRAKRAADWFWLVGYLAGKALHAAVSGDVEKAKHHTISSAAALYNWHCSISGTDVRMCPGRSDLAEMVDGQFPGEAHG